MTAASGKRLGKVLVRAGLITDEQLDAALVLAEDGRSLTTVLADENITTDVKIAQVVAESMGLAFVDLAGYEVDPNAAMLLANDLARRHHVLPIKIQDDELIVAMADPANIFAIDDLRIVTGYEIRPVVATESDLTAAIDKFATMNQNVDQMVGDIEDVGGEADREDESGTDDEAPVAKLMNIIVTEAIRQGAGDIYIEPLENELRVRYRIDGVCQEVMRSPKKLHRQLLSRLKIASGMDIAEKRVPQDGRFGVVLDGKTVDFRVAVLPTVNGEMSVLRLLRKDSIMLSLEDLGFFEEPIGRLLDALEKPYGCILVTGPTGSGKSTTLYAAINKTTKPTVNLITVEDPVEYRLEGLSQVHVNEKAGLTFAAALRSILRQDPDVVMIGEIRDKETATIAIEAALTGHLVLSTLHTNDAPSALTRLTEMGVEPFLSASAINCVLAQRLGRRLCPECKEAYVPTEEALQRVGFPYDPAKMPTLYKAVGCKRCNDIGYKGRMGIHEVMTVTEDIERACVNHASGDEIKRIAIAGGMRTLRDDGFAKALSGVTSIEEILRVVV
ncbi:MAG: ATPase, T2SS/T4P/T4SS family [Actinomycetota bacterium]|nr:MAG: type IV pilus assembly protein [Actinomycetota bacterium]MDO8949320.1 ATPase, T2SS/T4P/T4SS family [Actinomycetota bacterium]MDP3630700.1 ATPase, T2SS/T4P/T4SS family [Actinomycetota bacterium]